MFPPLRFYPGCISNIHSALAHSRLDNKPAALQQPTGTSTQDHYGPKPITAATAYPVLCPVWSAKGTGGFESLEVRRPGPSSGVDGSSEEDVRPKEGILLAMADSVPGMPMLVLLL